MMKKSLLINSEYCSMGRWISVIVGDALHMPLYEGKDLVGLVDEEWLTAEYLKDFDTRLSNMSPIEVKNNEEFQMVQKALSKAILKAVAKGPCIIHERAAATIIGTQAPYLSVLLYNKEAVKKIPRARADKTYDLSTLTDTEVVEFMKKEDYKREVYHNAISSTAWKDKESYTICLDSEVLTREKCAEILIEALSDVKIDSIQAEEAIKKHFD